MAAYYLESSAATKLYVQERGTGWVTGLADPAAGNELIIVRITEVEVAAALCRRARFGSLPAADLARAIALLRRNVMATFQIIEVTDTLCQQALILADQYALRGYDCVQLAGALEARRLHLAAGLASPILVGADAELNAAAIAESLQVEDPNAHP